MPGVVNLLEADDTVAYAKRNGEVRLGVVTVTHDNEMMEQDESDDEEEGSLPKGFVKVEWHPSGKEADMSEKKVVLVDRSLNLNETVCRRGRPHFGGVVQSVHVETDAVILPEKKWVLRGLADEGIQFASLFDDASANSTTVAYENWVGIYEDKVETLICRLKDTSSTKRFAISAGTDGISDLTWKRSQYCQFDNEQWYEGQTISVSPSTLLAARWIEPSKAPEAFIRKLEGKTRKRVKAVIEKVRLDSINVTWTSSIPNVESELSPIVAPPSLIEAEDLPKVKLVDWAEYRFCQIGDRVKTTLTTDGLKRLKVYEKWQSDVAKEFVAQVPIAKQNRCDLASSLAQVFRTAAGHGDDLAGPEGECDTLDPPMEVDSLSGAGAETHQPEPSDPTSDQFEAVPTVEDPGMDGNDSNWDTAESDVGDARDDADLDSDSPVSFLTSETGELAASASRRRHKRVSLGGRTRGKNRGKDSTVKKRRPRPGTQSQAEKKEPLPLHLLDQQVFAELLLVRSFYTVKWQDGTVEDSIPAAELMFGTFELDDHCFVPGEFVQKMVPDEQKAGRDGIPGKVPWPEHGYGVVVNVDSVERVAMVNWFEIQQVDAKTAAAMRSQDNGTFGVITPGSTGVTVSVAAGPADETGADAVFGCGTGPELLSSSSQQPAPFPAGLDDGCTDVQASDPVGNRSVPVLLKECDLVSVYDLVGKYRDFSPGQQVLRVDNFPKENTPYVGQIEEVSKFGELKVRWISGETEWVNTVEVFGIFRNDDDDMLSYGSNTALSEGDGNDSDWETESESSLKATSSEKLHSEEKKKLVSRFETVLSRALLILDAEFANLFWQNLHRCTTDGAGEELAKMFRKLEHFFKAFTYFVDLAGGPGGFMDSQSLSDATVSMIMLQSRLLQCLDAQVGQEAAVFNAPGIDASKQPDTTSGAGSTDDGMPDLEPIEHTDGALARPQQTDSVDGGVCSGGGGIEVPTEEDFISLPKGPAEVGTQTDCPRANANVSSTTQSEDNWGLLQEPGNMHITVAARNVPGVVMSILAGKREPTRMTIIKESANSAAARTADVSKHWDEPAGELDFDLDPEHRSAPIRCTTEQLLGRMCHELEAMNAIETGASSELFFPHDEKDAGRPFMALALFKNFTEQYAKNRDRYDLLLFGIPKIEPMNLTTNADVWEFLKKGAKAYKDKGKAHPYRLLFTVAACLGPKDDPEPMREAYSLMALILCTIQEAFDICSRRQSEPPPAENSQHSHSLFTMLMSFARRVGSYEANRSSADSSDDWIEGHLPNWRETLSANKDLGHFKWNYPSDSQENLVDMPDLVPIESGTPVEAVSETTLQDSADPNEKPAPGSDPSHLEVQEMSPPGHTFAKEAFKIDSASRFFMKAVRSEMALLAGSLPKDIYVKAYEGRMDLYSCMIIGPKDTPFDRGCFLFDIHLGGTYPMEPPRVHYRSFSSEQLNPNLYQDGKVCVSLLGTWNGKEAEMWNPGSNLLQVFVSIQGLILNAEPFYNEAGFESKRSQVDSKEKSRRYNEMALLRNLESLCNIARQFPAPFEKEIKDHIKDVVPELLRDVSSWLSNAVVPGFPLHPVSQGFVLSVQPYVDRLSSLVQISDL